MLYTVTPAGVEPVSVAEAKAHVRFTASAQDTYIGTLIGTARSHVESVTGRALVTRTLELRRPDFDPPDDRGIPLPRPPLVAVSTVKYLDADSVEQTIDAASYQIDRADTGSFLRIIDAPGSLKDDPEAVRIRYTAGYGSNAADVEAPLRHAILLLVGHWWASREPVGDRGTALPFAVDALLGPYKTTGWI